MHPSLRDSSQFLSLARSYTQAAAQVAANNSKEGKSICEVAMLSLEHSNPFLVTRTIQSCGHIKKKIRAARIFIDQRVHNTYSLTTQLNTIETLAQKQELPAILDDKDKTSLIQFCKYLQKILADDPVQHRILENKLIEIRAICNDRLNDVRDDLIEHLCTSCTHTIEHEASSHNTLTQSAIVCLQAIASQESIPAIALPHLRKGLFLSINTTKDNIITACTHCTNLLKNTSVAPTDITRLAAESLISIAQNNPPKEASEDIVHGLSLITKTELFSSEKKEQAHVLITQLSKPSILSHISTYGGRSWNALCNTSSKIVRKITDTFEKTITGFCFGSQKATASIKERIETDLKENNFTSSAIHAAGALSSYLVQSTALTQQTEPSITTQTTSSTQAAHTIRHKQPISIGTLCSQIGKQCVIEIDTIIQTHPSYATAATTSAHFKSVVQEITSSIVTLIPELSSIQWAIPLVSKYLAKKLLVYEQVPISYLLQALLTSCTRIIQQNVSNQTFLDMKGLLANLQTGIAGRELINALLLQKETAIDWLHINLLSIVSNMAKALQSQPMSPLVTLDGLSQIVLPIINTVLKSPHILAPNPLRTVTDNISDDIMSLWFPEGKHSLLFANTHFGLRKGLVFSYIRPLLKSVVSDLFSSIQEISSIPASPKDLPKDHPLSNDNLPNKVSINVPLPSYVKNTYLAMRHELYITSVPKQIQGIKKFMFHVKKASTLISYTLQAWGYYLFLQWHTFLSKDSRTVFARMKATIETIAPHATTITDQTLQIFCQRKFKQLFLKQDSSPSSQETQATSEKSKHVAMTQLNSDS